MNCRKLLSAVLLLGASVCVQAQGTCVIEGKVKNVKQGVCLNLFRIEGGVGSSVAVDTLQGDAFRFEVPVSGTERFNLGIRDGNSYSMMLRLWAEEGSHIRLTGEDMNTYTWQVESEVPQQKTWQLFVDDSRELWNCLQKNQAEQMRVRREYPGNPDDEEVRARVMALRDSLNEVNRDLSFRIDFNAITRMKRLPVEEVWMSKLKSLALNARYIEGYPYRKEVEELYDRLTDKQRRTPEALDVQTCLFLAKVASVQEKAADGELFDLQGKVHRLSDFKGKAVLMDFWSRGCGPCLKALPEMKEISRKYKGRLEVVSVSIDDKANWEKASRQHDISWWNLNDLKGNHGLYAQYSSGAIPRYVFLSPEGEVVEIWSGYGKGSLLEKLGKLMEE